MNAHNNPSPAPNDDKQLEEMLAPLIHIEPPLEARIANRQAVSAALHSFHVLNEQRHLPWWCRSISIPVPLAAALTLLMAFSLYSSFHNWQQPSVPLIAAPNKASAPAGSNSAAKLPAVANQQPVVTHYETEMYLCGVGRVTSESYYAIKE
jgi:hypothetical protein